MSKNILYEQQLLRNAQSEDKIIANEAMKEIIASHSENMKACARNILNGDEDLAKEVYGEVMYKFLIKYVKQNDFEWRGKSLGNILMRMTRNEAINIQRKRNKIPMENVFDFSFEGERVNNLNDLSKTDNYPSDNEERKDFFAGLKAKMNALLPTLTPKLREYYLAHREGYESDEIAEKLNITPLAKRQLNHRFMRRMEKENQK